MTATPHDSAALHKLFAPGELSRLLSDTAEVRAAMIVLGALAKAQGAAGEIPEVAGKAIHRASMELQIDPGGLALGAAREGTAIPALIDAFKAEMMAPEYAQHLGHGCTSDEIEDTALMLRLRQALSRLGTLMAPLLEQLADAGAEEIACGWRLLALRDELRAIEAEMLCVATGGEELARALNLAPPSGEDGAQAIADWAARLTLALAPLGLGRSAPRAAVLAALGAQASGLLVTLDAAAPATGTPAARHTLRLVMGQALLGAESALIHASALPGSPLRAEPHEAARLREALKTGPATFSQNAK
ncbi:hypothetical protein GCM10011415_13060 [Salipiger pallidus]|uniref:3-carboxy-cis,cis-muconate cycloisomerase n=1 Tax=Salipiger pallidus TaxID=1775170 RepID=A0A8J3EFY5_9RHOB|nr:hypothetical protein [Salipiger pallidus]GGG67440.1 hypothetical protein GCM10011415_13060 [Salipiger pallidus]